MNKSYSRYDNAVFAAQEIEKLPEAFQDLIDRIQTACGVANVKDMIITKMIGSSENYDRALLRVANAMATSALEAANRLLNDEEYDPYSEIVEDHRENGVVYYIDADGFAHHSLEEYFTYKAVVAACALADEERERYNAYRYGD